MPHAAAPVSTPADPIPLYRREPDGSPDRLLQTEWLLTDGLGGFAMGTVLGVPTRRYHGLLVPAMHPPVGRVLALNAVVDRLTVGAGSGERTFELSSFRFQRAEGLHPDGHTHLARFERGIGCRWVYACDGVVVERELRLLRAHRAAVLHWRVRDPEGRPVRLHARPLVSLRDFHHLLRGDALDRMFSIAPIAGGASVRGPAATVYLRTGSGAGFLPERQWWHDFAYERERDRGLDFSESLFSPGEFVARSSDGSLEMAVQASMADIALQHTARDEAERRSHLRSIITFACADPAPGTPNPKLADADRRALERLATASDDFVVLREGRNGEAATSSIIAGYPWFADWGRDTMISLPGLLLATGRFGEAFRTLCAFADRRRDGVIPNTFDDASGEAMYNTADASLWFLHAACDYLRITGDRQGFESRLKAACMDIVSAYSTGKPEHIRMDADGLIIAGTPETQLTWMDARRDGVVFTPRHGKPVEINALWYSGLSVLARAVEPVDATQASTLRELAERCAVNFREQFWNAERGCLYDCLAPAPANASRPGFVPVDEVRPNQIFAVSLPASPLSRRQRADVVLAVRERLLTPVGVRTLDPDDPRYTGRFEGPMFERDGAYHNGTVWPWLLGPVAEAVLRLGEFGPESCAEARRILMPITEAMDSVCPGHIPEVADGDDTADRPRRFDGCPAQAWSVAEPLRILAGIARIESQRSA